MQPITLRAFFSKTGRTKYISHLDMFRCIQRALKRTKLPVWYSQGYNPHIYLNFSLPLSLGFEGERESFDFRITEEMEYDILKDKINGVLPEGLQIHCIAQPVRKPEEIVWSEYVIQMEGENVQEIEKKWENFIKRDSIVVIKTTKKAQKELDLKPLFSVLSTLCKANSFAVTLRVASGTTLNVNPNLILQEFYSSEEIEPICNHIKRTKILTETCEDYQ